jgi:hypothetical protein
MPDLSSKMRSKVGDPRVQPRISAEPQLLKAPSRIVLEIVRGVIGRDIGSSGEVKAPSGSSRVSDLAKLSAQPLVHPALMNYLS